MGKIDLHMTDSEERRILRENKRHVFKNEPRGRTGDTFNIDEKRFELIDVSERSINTIAHQYYRVEGFNSRDDFISRWKADHSGILDLDKKLFIHWFRDITSPAGNDLV